MHIPDGYLSPQTCAVLGAAALPVLAVSVRRARTVARSRFAPLMAAGAAYSFLVMMLNVPIPDGTTAHAVGAVLIAILLGPYAAAISVSVALLIQALFFGDGGVLAYGANVFNMAVVMPFVGYAAYRLVARGSSLTGRRRAIAAGIGGYVGINAAALLAAVEFGLQPTLFHTAEGTPLYAPFHLSQTIPTMMLAHLTVAGFCEFALTASIVAYLQRANLPLLRFNHKGVPVDDAALVRRPRSALKWALVGLAVLVALTPLGLLAPGGAFGEDTNDWTHSVLGGYGSGSGQYVLSALVGILVIAAFYGAARLVGARRSVPTA